jgi:hypothetical protein
LIAVFNSGVGCNAWVARRAAHLVALHHSLLATGLDCSEFISDGAMCIREPIERRGNVIVVCPRAVSH